MKAERRRQFEIQMILSRIQPPGIFPLVLVLDHMKPTFNLGKIIRTANAFGIREVHLIGTPVFNYRPTKGALRKTKTRSFHTFEESHALLKSQGYVFAALDPSGSSSLGRWEMPVRTALVIGHEELGLSFTSEEYPDVVRLKIPQFGVVQSLNASIAGAIACYEYLRQRDFVAPELSHAESGRNTHLDSSAGSLGGSPLPSRILPLP